MTRVRIKYYVVRRGRGYWAPTKTMRARGFQLIACGPDGPAAWSVAEKWNARWQAARRGLETDLRPVWPPGSVGAAFDRFRQLDEWARKAPSTRQEWEERAWRRWIGPVFGDVDPRTIDVEDIEALRRAVADQVSDREAHRVIKIWRALWQAMASFRMVEAAADPSLAITNTAAPGRSQIWLEREARALVKTAWRAGYTGLAAALACLWDSGFSPVDIRQLTAGQIRTDGTGLYIDRTRAKTGRRAIGTLSRRSAALLMAYIQSTGLDYHAEAPVFRTPALMSGPGRRRSPAIYSKDLLGKHFRIVRAMVFGDMEDRTMLDFRRSTAVEMLAGGAEAEEMSQKLANAIGQSRELQRTYLPHQVSVIRMADAKRRIGRQRLAQNGSGTKS